MAGADCAGLTRLGDVRRHVAFRAYGAARILIWGQSALEDVEGALEQRQYDVAAYQGRVLVLQCLSVRSLAHEGEVDLAVDSVSFDFFAGLPEQDVSAALALANEGLDIDEGSAGAWLARLHAYVAETEALLGYDAPLPVLRSPEGLFGAIGIARRWIGVVDELHLPALLPREWIS